MKSLKSDQDDNAIAEAILFLLEQKCAESFEMRPPN
jgi:hypothetical protein